LTARAICLEVYVARYDLVERVDDADDRLFDLAVPSPRGFEKGRCGAWPTPFLNLIAVHIAYLSSLSIFTMQPCAEFSPQARSYFEPSLLFLGKFSRKAEFNP
jgi:hypothetical protein